MTRYQLYSLLRDQAQLQDDYLKGPYADTIDYANKLTESSKWLRELAHKIIFEGVDSGC